MRVATEEEVKALQLQQQQRQRLKQQQQQKQRRGLQIESVARTRQRNMQQAKSLHPKWQIPSNVIVKKIILPPTPSQLRRAERR